MLLKSVRKDTLDWLDFVCFANSANVLSDFLVKTTNTESSDCSSESVICSKDYISLLSIGLSTNNDGMSSVGNISINMSTELNLDKVSVLESDRVFLEWGEVSGNLIDREAAWESNTSFELLCLFAVINILKFFIDESVDLSANSRDISTFDRKLDGKLKSSYKYRIIRICS